ncbi:MAG: NAD(P)H-dependent oxidoreductase [Chloroflexota bacterium]|nr:NAD(P)H-dependent oxidoreductase [Chloroflexota bacterium]
MPSGEVEVAALVGSLRQQSYNRGLLRTAMLLQPEGMRIYEVPIDRLPFYDEDAERQGDPPAVREFKGPLQRADALLFLTPEYNYSIPGVLKNAIDWASRPSGRSVVRGKPAAIMGAAVGRSGTMRAQLHLRQICVHLGVVVIPEPEIYITFAADKFNALGELTDQPSLEQTRQLLHNLQDWALMLR